MDYMGNFTLGPTVEADLESFDVNYRQFLGGSVEEELGAPVKGFWGSFSVDIRQVF